MSVFKIDTSKYWASLVMRVQKNGEDYIAANIRPSYEPGFMDVSDITGDILTIGQTKEQLVRKMFDKEPSSPTFGKRINDPNYSTGRWVWKFNQKMTKEAIKEIESMCGVSNPHGDTQYVWMQRGKNSQSASSLKQLTTANSPDEIMAWWKEKEEGVKKTD